MKQDTKTPEDQLQVQASMRKAVAEYTGPVNRCRPGKARAPAEVAIRKNNAVEWLIQHRRDPKIVNEGAKRQLSRLEKYRKNRFAARNAPLLLRLRAKGEHK